MVAFVGLLLVVIVNLLLAVILPVAIAWSAKNTRRWKWRGELG